jgi:hypothetical protein
MPAELRLHVPVPSRVRLPLRLNLYAMSRVATLSRASLHGHLNLCIWNQRPR